jgi:hypothetical protein
MLKYKWWGSFFLKQWICFQNQLPQNFPLRFSALISPSSPHPELLYYNSKTDERWTLKVLKHITIVIVAVERMENIFNYTNSHTHSNVYPFLIIILSSLSNFSIRLSFIILYVFMCFGLLFAVCPSQTSKGFLSFRLMRKHIKKNIYNPYYIIYITIIHDL